MHVAGETIELGDRNRATQRAGLGEPRSELRATIERIASLAGLDLDELGDDFVLLAADSLTLFNRGATIVIAVRAASFRSVRGLTCVAAVADEIAFWQAEDGSANPDTEILRAVRPTLLTTRGPLIAISSPYARRGELWTTFKRDYGPQGDPRILVAHAASREMNPTLRQADIDREMDKDPAAGLAEYYAEFRTDISAFVSQEVIDGCVARGVFELPPAADVSYLGFVDPSGGASDAMALAIAHRVGDMVILDAAREIQPPFNPDAATTEFSTLLKAYGVAKVIGDRYAGEWVREPFRRHGIDYQLSEAPKSDIYRDALPLFNAGRAQLLDLKRLVNQLCSLERRTARGGRDLIDHPQHPGAHDDLANAVCGAFVMLERDRRPQLISVVDVVGVDGLPPPLPRSQYVFAAVWAAGADVAAVYGASSGWSEELFVADFDAVLYHGGFFADLATRLRELAKACRAQGCFVFGAWGAHPTYRAARGHGPRNPALARSGRNPAFRRRVHQERAGQVLPADDRQDGDPPLGRGVELQGRRSGRGGAARRVPSRNFLEVRSPAFVQAQAESLSYPPWRRSSVAACCAPIARATRNPFVRTSAAPVSGRLTTRKPAHAGQKSCRASWVSYHLFDPIDPPPDTSQS